MKFVNYSVFRQKKKVRRHFCSFAGGGPRIFDVIKGGSFNVWQLLTGGGIKKWQKIVDVINGRPHTQASMNQSVCY